MGVRVYRKDETQTDDLVYGVGSLQNHTTVSLAVLGSTEEGSPRGILEHFTYALTRSRRAFQIVLGANLVRHGHTLEKETHKTGSFVSREKKRYRRREKTYLLWGDWALVGLPQLVDYSRVPPKVLLAPDKNDRQTGTKMHHLRDPL